MRTKEEIEKYIGRLTPFLMEHQQLEEQLRERGVNTTQSTRDIALVLATLAWVVGDVTVKNPVSAITRIVDEWYSERIASASSN